ncbi:STAS domain-containing protein [Mycobacterium sp. NPDC050551]|uniref:STAS domain-containing protein n=1 Tax=Mycobacterium sp. NPDC050551 TaxID=3155407 RepID=UPI00343858E0
MNRQHAVRAGFGITREWIDSLVVISVSGDLDMLTAPELSEAIEAALREVPAALIVDLSEVHFLAAAGMNLLLVTQCDMPPSVPFAVVADGPATRRPLALTAVDAIVSVHRTLDEALNHLG